MKSNSLITVILVIVAFAAGYLVNNFVGGDKIKSESQVNLTNDWDSLSYIFGLSMGYSTEGIFSKIDPVLVGSGMNAVLNDTTIYDPSTVNILQRKLIDGILLKKEEEGKQFLMENASKEGVFVTASGLQYEPIVEGDGPTPADTSNVRVIYHGTLVDGTIFDSSRDRGDTVQLNLQRVIPGWTEGLQLMSVGSKYKLYVPSRLGYGPRPQSNVIPPNAVLIFEVELVSIDD